MGAQETWDEMEARHMAERRSWLAAFMQMNDVSGDLNLFDDERIKIVAQVAQEHKVKFGDVKGRDRITAHVTARNEAYSRLSKAGYSKVQIAQYFGRDRSGISYGIKCHDQRFGQGLPDEKDADDPIGQDILDRLGLSAEQAQQLVELGGKWANLVQLAGEWRVATPRLQQAYRSISEARA